MYIIKILSPVLLGCLLFLCPIPEGMDPRGWSLFAIFVATILGVVLKPLPMGPTTLLGLAVALITHTIDIQESLSGFGSSMIWLIVFVFFIARGFIKTKLGTRIAYGFVSLMGRKPLGLGYGIILTELLIAPLIPSNSARAGGIMYPIVRSIAEALGSTPKHNTEQRIGSFLVQVCFHGNIITSAMFLTAMAANSLVQSIAAKKGAVLTWTNWFTAAVVPGLLSLIVIPLVIYFFYPPKIKYFPEAVSMAKDKLKEMGPISLKEWTMISIFVFMLTLWVLSESLNVHTCTTALVGLCLLLLTRILEWKDVLHEHEAWDVLIWLSTLVTMSTLLEKYGFIAWFGECISCVVLGWPWMMAFLFLSFVYFYTHYFFSSNSAHVSAMYGAFLGVAIACGAPPLLSALILGFWSSLFSSMTHYGTSAGVVLYGMGYVQTTMWWKLGFIMSVVNLTIWLGVGGVWWKILGLW